MMMMILMLCFQNSTTAEEVPGAVIKDVEGITTFVKGGEVGIIAVDLDVVRGLVHGEGRRCASLGLSAGRASAGVAEG